MPTCASFLVTEDCNLACTYCFELDGRNKNYMSKETARTGIQFLADNALQNGDNYFNAMIFGGEPLLNIEVVEEIFKYGLELGAKYNLRFESSIVTNATILTKEVERVLREYKDKVNLNVQLSVDGIREIQDAYRITKAGTGSFDMVEKNIPRWKDIFKDNIHRLSLHGCSNKETLPHLYENFIFFRKTWNIPRIWFMPIHSEEWTNKDVDIYEEQLMKIVEFIIDDAKLNKNYQEVANYAPLDKATLCYEGFPKAPCGAGASFITITANGNLWPCHQIYFNDPEEYYKIGDIFTGIDESKRRLFLDLDNSDFSCASIDPDCDAYGCYRCMGDNLTENGSILSVVDCQGPRCKMSKVERKIQVKIRKELENMGLIQKQQTYAVGNNSNNPACLCDVRTMDKDINCLPGNNPNNPACLCDARGGIELSDFSKKECKCIENNDSDTIALALSFILDKLDTIEKGQEFIIKKILD